MESTEKIYKVGLYFRHSYIWFLTYFLSRPLYKENADVIHVTQKSIYIFPFNQSEAVWWETEVFSWELP